MSSPWTTYSPSVGWGISWGSFGGEVLVTLLFRFCMTESSFLLTPLKDWVNASCGEHQCLKMQSPDLGPLALAYQVGAKEKTSICCCIWRSEDFPYIVTCQALSLSFMYSLLNKAGDVCAPPTVFRTLRMANTCSILWGNWDSFSETVYNVFDRFHYVNDPSTCTPVWTVLLKGLFWGMWLKGLFWALFC